MREMQYISNGKLEVEEYNELRTLVGWLPIKEERAARDLSTNLYRIVVRDKSEKLVGMARIVGNGGFFFSLVDVIVHPDYQHQGIGKEMLRYISEAIEKEGAEDDPILLNLVAAKGMEEFYQKYLGMQELPCEHMGAGMLRWIK